MSFLSKRRTIVVGGMKATINIKNGVVKSFSIRDKTFMEKTLNAFFVGDKKAGQVEIGKLPKEFISFLEKSDGNTVINLNNPIFDTDKIDKNTRDSINTASRILTGAINRYSSALADKDSLTPLQKKEANLIYSSGVLTKRNEGKLKRTYDDSLGIRSIIYKSLISMGEFSAKGLIDKIKPKGLGDNLYSTVDYNQKNDIGTISQNELERKLMIDAIIKLSETMDSMNKRLESVIGLKDNNNKAEINVEKRDVEKVENVIQNQQDAVLRESDIKKDEIVENQIDLKPDRVEKSKINFGDKNIQSDINTKWSGAREKNISTDDPCFEFLNINTVRFNGISKAKLDRWKNNELSKKDSTKNQDVLDGYVNKNLAYAKELTKIGILLEVSPDEFEFVSPKAREILYKNYDKSLQEISDIRNGKKINVANDVNKNVTPKSTMSVKQYNHIMEENAHKLNDFIDTHKDMFRGDEAKLIGDNYNKFIQNLKAQNVPDDIFVQESSGYLNRLIMEQRGKIKKVDFEDINLDVAPEESMTNFEYFARATAASAQGIVEDTVGEIMNQNLASGVIADVEKKIDEFRSERPAEVIVEEIEEMDKKARASVGTGLKV